MTEQELRDLIAAGETLTVEFKSDREPLSDAALLETVVCLANGKGGTLLIGVEDDGRVTGLHPRHRTHPAALVVFVANRTVPPATVEAEFVELPEETVAVLAVSAARQPVTTSDGRLLIRYVDSRGQPGCRPDTRRQAIAATGLSEEQARYQLRKLTESGALELVGTGRGAYYRAPQTGINGE
jgi:ATP-dependent DNA helicase RecG